MVSLNDACEILKWSSDVDIQVLLDGGWGVDALLGKQTRPHNDIDLFIEENDHPKFIQLIKSKGFVEIIMDYTNNWHTVWADDLSRIIDLHMYKDNLDGNISYNGESFSKEIFNGNGIIGETIVQCINVENQILFHLGYDFDKNDIHDVKLLCKRFDIALPEEYRNTVSN